MQVEMIAVEALVPYARNTRTHSEAQILQVAASITEFGFTNPVLIDADGGIIAGHGRALAAKKIGMADVPCIRLGHLSDAQKRAYVIADNKLAMNAGWDLDMLRAELVDLRDAGFCVGLTGFSDDELLGIFDPTAKDGKADPDELPMGGGAGIVSCNGDVWVLDTHRVMCGDSTVMADVDRLMAGVQADVCWTDPPYNVAYDSKLAGKLKNDDMSDDKFCQFLVDAFRCMWASMKPGASIYVAHADTEGFNFRYAYKNAGFKLSGCLVWRKDSLVLGRSDYQWIHEPILYGWKEGAAHRFYGGRKQTTFVEMGEDCPFKQMADGTWSVKIGDRLMIVDGSAKVEELVPSIITQPKPKRSVDHPTMKPIALIERMLKFSARTGDVVLDLFGGSGSTLIAADRLGMSARLMELDPKFCDVAVRRWQQFTGKTAVLESTGQPFPADLEKAA